MKKAVDHRQLIEMLISEFPDALARIDDVHGRGLLHIEVGVFRQATEAAMDAGQAWLAEKHFRFIERMLVQSDGEVANALEVSYLEDLALGEWTPQRHDIIKERMPKTLRDALIRHHPKWQ